MAKTQQFNASVNFGGKVDSSLGSSLKRLTSGIEDVGSKSLKTMNVQTAWQRKAAAGARSTTESIKHMDQATRALNAQQASLEKQIREGAKAGKDIRSLTEDYQRVSVGIHRATEEMKALNAQLEKEQRIERMKSSFGAGIRKAGSGVLSGTKAAIGFTAGKSLELAKWGTLGLLGLSGGALALNEKAAESYTASRRYGIAFPQYQGMSELASRAGIDAEAPGALAEELKNKIGENGNDKTINPILSQLGLTKSKALSMGKNELFNFVMNRLTTTKGRFRIKSDTIAASVADQLLGGDANQIVTMLRQQGFTFTDAVTDISKKSLLSEKEAEQAYKSSQAISDLWYQAQTGLMGVMGDLGPILEPAFREMGSELNAWFKRNQTRLQGVVSDWMKEDKYTHKTGPERLVEKVQAFGSALSDVSHAMLQVARWVNEHMPVELKSDPKSEAYVAARDEGLKKVGDQGFGFFESDKKSAWVEQYAKEHTKDFLARQGWQEQNGEIAPLAFDDRTTGIPFPVVPATGKGTPALQPQGNTITMGNVSISVVAAPGQTPEDVGQSVYDQFSKLVQQQGRSNAFDMPG